ncbi:MAG: hypothetical protein J5820_01460 [Rhodocyclaceae bacterium]|nr:hypothetical protein [Rhodocyclaceae bacterium]
MVLNYLWIGFFLVAFAVALARLVFFGDTEVFPALVNATFDASKSAFDIALGLTGALALWLGIMKIGERGGVVDMLARALSPLFRRLFPEIPANHPATGSIFMNIAANMLGLDNAATPLGLKAMEQMQDINKANIQTQRENGSITSEQAAQLEQTATNPMIMFLVLNTSGLTIVPISIMAYRAQQGAAQPADIFLPILLATFFATLVGVLATAAVQRIRLLTPATFVALGVISAAIAALVFAFHRLDSAAMNTMSVSAASVILMAILCGFIVAALVKKENVYDAFIEGAREGFTTAVRIIPYLVAILVAIAVFRASGALEWVMNGVRALAQAFGADAAFVDALPTALLRPLSGSGARGMMLDAMQQHGADSFVGRLACIFQGSTDTTFYILAVYFGSVGVRYTRHAAACGLLADAAGIAAAIAVAVLFFG